ncbi:MAG: hypothetical protein D6785_02480 [Planctomycetota bacterium]|nr:MAG: hypothetical protein D6785_02480 [Planctomycetota bacterium]
MKNFWILLTAVSLFALSGCSREVEAAKSVCQQYLRAFQKEDFETMWDLLSKGQKEKMASQLAILKAQKGKKIALRGLIQLDSPKIQSWTEKDYYIAIVKRLHQLLKEKKGSGRVFDLLHAMVEKGELKGKRVIVTLFDGAHRRKLLMINEKINDQEVWRVDEEYVFLGEEEK